MKNKKMILAAVALVLVVALMAGVYFATKPSTSEGSKAVTVTVVHADGTEKVFECRTDAVYLDELLKDEKIAEGDQTEYGFTIHTVDGEKADWSVNQSYWAIIVNGEYAMTGASATPVTDGDAYRLEYTIG